MKDLTRICKSSEVGAEIIYENIPITNDIDDLSYGDDYKLCYTCSSELKDNEYISEDFCIGKIKSDKKIIIKKIIHQLILKSMGGILLNKKIGIIGGGITGTIVDFYHKVSIFYFTKCNKLTKLLHGGLRYLENFYFNEVKNGLNDRSWWLENFPKQTRKLKIVIPFKSRFSLALIKLELSYTNF